MLLLVFALAALSASGVAPHNPARVAFADAQSSSSAASVTPSQAINTVEPQKITAYSLPPDLYRKARDLGKIHFRLALVGFVYGIVILWLVLHWRLAPKYRDWAEWFSRNRFFQSMIYAPLILLTLAAMGLPLDIYAEVAEKQYGISVQSWGSWSWDWLKGQLLVIVFGVVLIWILYVVVRKSPRRWWFYFWLVAMPIGIFVFFIGPWVIDPMFHQFVPLQQKDPALTASLEKMVERSGESIPPDRMFWMGAGEKTTGLNAYVTGMGASKRIVVWDTTIAKMSPPEIVFVAGHEMGHYVLQHIYKGLAFFAALALLFFYLGYRSIGWVLRHWGAGWHIRGLDDWASLPVLFLLLSLFSFAASPLTSAFSRYLEHQADQYGLEVTHSLTPDSGQVAAQAFQVLGEVDLSDPAPNPLDVFLFYSHPPIPDRMQFCLTYNPWKKSGHGKFIE
jgi:Zn-dependent protease with chaperone function